jgi:hypothetical protein
MSKEPFNYFEGFASVVFHRVLNALHILPKDTVNGDPTQRVETIQYLETPDAGVLALVKKKGNQEASVWVYDTLEDAYSLWSPCASVAFVMDLEGQYCVKTSFNRIIYPTGHPQTRLVNALAREADILAEEIFEQIKKEKGE